MILTINYRTTAPVSHIGETASTGSYFQTIKTRNGRLPIITANSVRGILRDCGAKFLLDILNTKVNKETFNVLFSGGNLNGTVKNDVGKAKNVREHFPLISVFGGGLGDMILSGKIAAGNLYPICKESEEITKIESDISYKNLIEEIEYTRTDDGKEDTLANKYMQDPTEEKTAKASTQMRYSVQYMAVGSEFIQKIYCFPNMTKLEEAALFATFYEWFKLPRLGGMANKGFGLFDAITDFGISVMNGEISMSEEFKEQVEIYINFIESEGAEYLNLLGGGKNGKK